MLSTYNRNSFDEKLPDTVMLPTGRLTRLQSLNLSDCNLKRVPDVLRTLVNLFKLDLSENPLMDGLDVLPGLPNLHVLLMRSCSLCSVPIALCKITALEYLDLSNNNITIVENVR